MTKPLHESQRIIRETKTNVFFEWALIPNPELISALLSFGEHLKVLMPSKLAAEMKDHLEKARRNYPE